MLTLYSGKKDELKDHHLQLHLAATNGNVGLVKFALDHGAPMDSALNGFLPLQLACISDNNLAVVQYLIDRGAQVNAQRWSKKHSSDKSQAVIGGMGSTALHVACANGCTKVVELLLRNNAQVDLKDKYGSRPRDIAMAKQHMEIVILLDASGGLQKKHDHQERRSMNITGRFSSRDDNERVRRQSLPAVFGDQTRMESESGLGISSSSMSTPLTSHRRVTSNISQLTSSSSTSYPDTATQPIDILPDQYCSNPLPVLSSSVSNSTAICTPLPSPTSFSHSKKADRYSYGVLHHDGTENYLTSLERRAYKWNDLPVRHSYDQSQYSYLAKPPVGSYSAITHQEVDLSSSFSVLGDDRRAQQNTPTTSILLENVLVPPKSLSTTAISPTPDPIEHTIKRSSWRGSRSMEHPATPTSKYFASPGQRRKIGFLTKWIGSRVKK